MLSVKYRFFTEVLGLFYVFIIYKALLGEDIGVMLANRYEF